MHPSINSTNWSSRDCGMRALLIPLAVVLAWVGLSHAALAVDPPPDGGYPNQNTAEGEDALLNLTTGLDNTAVGFHALCSNTTANFNTATGYLALFLNKAGNNTATGAGALEYNTYGECNTANGFNALSYNVSGLRNTATGAYALWLAESGGNNTATGGSALSDNRAGSNNTATGVGALQRNTTGDDNTAVGFGALCNNSSGNNNTAVGINALSGSTVGDNSRESSTAIGIEALGSLATGRNDLALGCNAGMNLIHGHNNVYIVNRGVSRESGTMRIGIEGTQKSTFVAGITGMTVAGGVGVIIDSSGHLGTVTSSARYKEKIKPMDDASEAILSLQPVAFRYKKELDPDGIPQFGLVAEEVAKVDPDLIARDESGKPYTVRYEAVNAMLLNEFLKEHRKVEAQERKLESLEQTVSELKAAMKGQARGTPNKF